jgi:CTP synthase (UTP-ammonia lyase)
MPKIAIIGDFNPDSRTHVATVDAVVAASRDLALEPELTWLATDAPSLADDAREALAVYDGLWVAPGSPYRSLEGALAAIRYAREQGVPLFAT